MNQVINITNFLFRNSGTPALGSPLNYEKQLFFCRDSRPWLSTLGRRGRLPLNLSKQ